MKDGEKLQQDMAKAVQAMKENLPALIEMEHLKAVLLRKKYTALVANGFTDQQALALCGSA